MPVSPDDTTPDGVPVVELDPCELVTEEDYGNAGLTRPLPSPTDARFVPGILAIALTLAGCIHTRTGPHDTPVIDGASADGGRE